MRILVLAIPVVLTGCVDETALRPSAHELAPEQKRGCYVKEMAITGTVVDGMAQKDSVFCTEQLPPGFSYSYDNGRTKVQIKTE